MQKHIVLFLFMITAVCAAAQTATVRDRLTRQPLELVALYSPGRPEAAFTDAKGHADLSPFRGADSIVFQFLGYRTTVLSFAALESAGFEVHLETDAVSLETIVVSAVRWQQSSREAPARVSAIRPREVMLQNPQTAADMLGIGGEVFIQKSQQGGGSPMIRGFATNRVLITVDGVRMNTAIFRSGNLQNVISLDPFATERTELIFGPGSTIYGSDAIGGVMNFFTLQPAFSKNDTPLVRGNAALRYATANNEKTAHADVNIGSRRWAFLSSMTYTDYGDLRMGSYGPDDFLRPNYVQRINNRDSVLVNPDPRVQRPSGYAQLNLMQKIRFKPSEKWDIQYGGHYSATSSYARYDRLTRPRGSTLRSAEWDYGPQIWMMHNLSVMHAPGSGLYDRLNARIAYQFFEESRIERDLNRPTRMIRTEQVDAYSANMDMEKRLGALHQLYYGFEGVFNKVHSTGEDLNITTGQAEESPSRYPDGASWRSLGAYLIYAYKPGARLIFQTGLRYGGFGLNADFDRRFFPFPFETARQRAGALTGSLGAVFNPRQDLQLSANLSTGFRAPNVDDIGKVFDSTPGAVTVPNPDLKPEYAYNADLGLAKTFGNVLRADFTAFYNLLNHALVRRNFTLNGLDSILYNGELSRVEAIQNAASAYVWGVQAGVELKLPLGFSLSSRFNYQKGEEELDDGSNAPLRHAAPWFGVTRLAFSANGFRAELYSVYNGTLRNDRLAPEEQAKTWMYAKDEAGKPYSPGWITLNLKAMYQLSPRINLSAGLENIADVRYRPYSSGLSGPGRNLVLAVRGNW